MDKRVNYDKLTSDYLRHHERYARRVETTKDSYGCRECKGRGGWVEVIDIEIGGPWETCGWCEGTGHMTGWHLGLWLRFKKQEKAEKRKELAARR